MARHDLIRAKDLARRKGLPLLTTNDVHFYHYEHKILPDVLTCIRLHKTLETVGHRIKHNGKRYIKPEPELRHLP